MEKIISLIKAFETELHQNKKLKQVAINYFDSLANSNQLNELEQSGKIEKSVLGFYRKCNGFEIKWHPADEIYHSNEIIGAVKITAFQQVMRNWLGVVYFDDEPENTLRRIFFPVDFFADEAAAGFCTLEGYRNSLYLFKFEGDPIPLYVKFSDYLELMLCAKGCYYWQYLVFEILEKKENEVSSRIKKYLPDLFPNFSFDIFKQLFDKLRLK